MECVHPGNFPVRRNFQEVVTVEKKIEDTIQPVDGLGFHSSANEDVDHDAWSSRADVSRDCDKYIEWNSRRQKVRCTFTLRRNSGSLSNCLMEK